MSSPVLCAVIVILITCLYILWPLTQIHNYCLISYLVNQTGEEENYKNAFNLSFIFT